MKKTIFKILGAAALTTLMFFNIQVFKIGTSGDLSLASLKNLAFADGEGGTGGGEAVPLGSAYSTWDKTGRASTTTLVYDETGFFAGVQVNPTTNAVAAGISWTQTGLKGFLTDCSGGGIYCGQDRPTWTPVN